MNSPHSHCLTQEARRNPHEIETFPDREPSQDQADPSEREEGELASDHGDPDLDQGDSNLEQLMLTEEKQ